MSSVLALALGAFAIAGPGSASASPSTAPAQLVVNGTFDRGLAGWIVGDSRSAVRLDPDKFAVLSVPNGGKAFITDEQPTVRGAKAGDQFNAQVRVRGSRAGIAGALVVRHADKTDNVRYSRARFTLSGTGWTTLKLPVSVAADGTRLDLRVRADVRAADRLSVDDFSLVRTANGTEPNAEDPRGPVLTNNCATDQRGIPVNACATYFGSAYGGNADPTPWEQQMGKQLGVRRTYYQASQVAGALRTVRIDLAAKRLPWISFKFPHNWADMAAGKGDAWAKDIATQLATVNGPVWIAFHHEPEGDGNLNHWTAIQARLAPIIRNNAANVAYSIVLTGYNQVAGPAEYRLDALWPANTEIDILGVDTYNHYGVVKNGKAQTFHTDFVNKYYKPFEAFAKKKGIDWGIAETGFTNEAAVDQPQWLAQAYKDMKTHGGIAFTYFNTNLNSIANWELSTQLKKQGFTTALKTSPTLR